MIINIYGLVYPSTQEVIYVGQTRTSIEHRLDSHYWKLNKGFAEHLSAIRKGKNNPMAQRLEIKIGAYKENNLIKSFEYGFEINEFIGSKSAYSNVHKVLTGKLIYKPYGYNWKYIE